VIKSAVILMTYTTASGESISVNFIPYDGSFCE